MKDQKAISEILFLFHVDQAASHMMAMGVTTQLTHEVKQDFNLVQKTMKRIWKKQDQQLKELFQNFEDNSIMLNEVLQLFLQAKDAEQFLNKVKEIEL